MSNNGHKADQLDERRGEVPPEDNKALEQGTLVIENAALRKGFTITPNYILRDPSISPGAKATYSLLLSYAWQEGSCFPGQERLARDLGTHKRSIIRWLQELEDNDYISKRRRGMGKTNVYSILDVKKEPEVTATKEEVTKSALLEVTQTSHQEVTKSDHNEDTVKEDIDEKDLDTSNSRDQQSSPSGKTRNHAKNPSNGRGVSENENEGEAWSDNIAKIMEDLTKFDLHDLEDPANVYRNPKRTMKLWRKSGLSEEDFIPLLYEAKKITLQNSGSIRKNAGESRSTKNRAPYFFGVLDNLIAAKQVEKLEEKRKEALAKTQGGFVKRMSP